MTSAPQFPVLLDRDTLLRRIAELGRTIVEHEYVDGQPPVLVAVIDGARTFTRHLVHHLPGGPHEVHEIRASSYGNGTVSSGTVNVVGGERHDVAGRRVLLLEDIVDTGRTVERLGAFYLERGAERVNVATLLSKPSRRVVDVELAHVGFEIEDRFVIGFGMDVAGRYRELPEIVVYDEALERAASAD